MGIQGRLGSRRLQGPVLGCSPRIMLQSCFQPEQEKTDQDWRTQSSETSGDLREAFIADPLDSPVAELQHAHIVERLRAMRQDEDPAFMGSQPSRTYTGNPKSQA